MTNDERMTNRWRGDKQRRSLLRRGDLEIAFPRAKHLQKRFALCREPFFEFLRAIAVATRPRFCPVLVSAITAGVRILHAEQLEILFPIRTFLGERRIAKARLNPCREAVRIHPRLLHVMEVLVASDRTFPERLVFNCLEQSFFALLLNTPF